jgi:CRP-like cAMP-binding protein
VNVSASRNLILSRLQPGDFQALAPHLEAIELPLRHAIEKRGRPIEHVYFLERGVASVVANGTDGRAVEVGMIGREGLTGLAVIMGDGLSPYDTFMQAEGAGFRAPSAVIRQAAEQSADLRHAILRYAHILSVQTAQTALSNARNKLEERLSRWLLMVHDRIDGNELMLTHEYLATMLGVRRAGVTIALNALEKIGLVEVRRGAIIIMDREGLVRSANGAYGMAEAEMSRILS